MVYVYVYVYVYIYMGYAINMYICIPQYIHTYMSNVCTLCHMHLYYICHMHVYKNHKYIYIPVNMPISPSVPSLSASTLCLIREVSSVATI